MKKLYQSPSICIASICFEDVLTASSGASSFSVMDGESKVKNIYNFTEEFGS